MLDYYCAARLSRGQAGELASSALPGAPVLLQWEGRPRSRNRRGQVAAPAPADAPVAVGPNQSSTPNPCPCGQRGIAREDLHGCVALVKELFPQLDQELDAWEAAYGWLYR